MSKGVEFPPAKRAEILALLGQGKKIREIEEATGVAWQTIYGWRRKDPEWLEAMDTARVVFRLYKKDLHEERRDFVADELYEQAARLKVDNPDAYVTLLLKLHELHEKQIQKLEITGEGGGPVAITHDQRLTLAHLYAFAGTVDGSGVRSGGVLPDTRELLPAPEDGGTAAGALPAGPES